MGKVMTLSQPLLFQSKLLCFSLFYLFTSLFLSLYTSLSPTKCLFRSSPFDPIQSAFFFYPSSYGEHKYALPTRRSSCNSPVLFSDYWDVVKEFKDLCQSASLSSKVLKYMKGKGETFAGNLSLEKRLSYFDRQYDEQETEIPCGFLKEFPIELSDKIAMENCKGVLVVSAVFGDHDKIRQPKGLGSKTLENVCFFMFVDDTTLKALNHHKLISTTSSSNHQLGVWRLVNVNKKGLYENPAMNGVIPKYLVHRLFPNAKFSIWVDGKMQLMIDPLLLIHSLVLSKNVDMAISKHPYFVHTIEEAMATARWKKWNDIYSLKMQMETYCENGLQPWSAKKLPYTSDVPDSAVIIRKHDIGSNLFSCLLFNELEAFNPRDQLAFAYIRDKMKKPKVKINMFEVEVFEKIAIEYRHNLKHSSSSSIDGPTPTSGVVLSSKIKRPKFDSLANGNNSKCERYLLEMWGENH